MTAYTDNLIEAMATVTKPCTACNGAGYVNIFDAHGRDCGVRQCNVCRSFCEIALGAKASRAALIAQLKFMIERGPSERQLDGARDWSLRKNGLGVGNDQATGCYQAMCRALLWELEGP